MKRWWILFIMLVLGFSNQAFANVEDREITRSVEELNRIRNQLSLPPFSVDQSLEEAAANHNRYMNYSGLYSSIEEFGKTYYRGRYPWDRTSYAGYEKSYVMEMLAKDLNTFTEGWENFLRDPYLRYHLLNPNYRDLGMDRFSHYSTYLLGGNPSDAEYEVIYPYPNQIKVPIENQYYFDKNPYEIIGKKEIQGYPITYTYYSPKKVERFEIREIHLIRLNNYQRMPIEFLREGVPNTLIVLPLVKLETYSSYNFKIKMNLIFTDGSKKEVYHSVNFTTQEKPGDYKSTKYLTRLEFVKKLVQVFKYPIRTGLEIIFKDVSNVSSDYKYVYTAYDENLVKGNGRGEFMPNANMREQDVYVVLIRAYEKQRGKINLTEKDEATFLEDIREVYAKNPLRKAVKIGLIDKKRKNFDPGHYITVEEFDEIIQKFQTVFH